MQWADSTFWKYAFSFGLILIVSFALLLLTNHLGNNAEPQTTCITSSGEPC